MLGELAQMFSEPSYREKLQATDDPAEIHRLFTDWKV